MLGMELTHKEEENKWMQKATSKETSTIRKKVRFFFRGGNFSNTLLFKHFLKHNF